MCGIGVEALKGGVDWGASDSAPVHQIEKWCTLFKNFVGKWANGQIAGVNLNDIFLYLLFAQIVKFDLKYEFV